MKHDNELIHKSITLSEYFRNRQTAHTMTAPSGMWWQCNMTECTKKVKFSRYRPNVAQRVGRGIALLFHDRGTRTQITCNVFEFLGSRPYTFPNVRTAKPKEVNQRYSTYTIINRNKFYILFRIFQILICVALYNAKPESNKILKY